MSGAALLLQLSGNQSVLNPHGPVAGELARASQIFSSFYFVVWLIVMVFLAVALLRGRKGRHLGETGSTRLLIYAGVAVPLVVLVGHLIYSISVGRIQSAEPHKDRGALIVHINGKQWWWDVRYRGRGTFVARTANEIHIPTGQPVVFELESTDVIHSFWVPALAGKMDLIPGRTNDLWLQADKPGVYRGQCAEYCGAQHAHMGFEVIAEPPDQFAKWLEWQGRPALPPDGEQAKRGQRIFAAGPCGMCHAVRGTQALAQVGPDLTHVAGRKWLASATSPNNRGGLKGWILNAQCIKPGNHMPRITLPPRDADDLIAYLETLE